MHAPGESLSNRKSWNLFSLSIPRNSQPLDFNAGYWAESFPETENPLCAAIDPSRSFRWHALNCNGPATAAFLCELPGKENRLIKFRPFYFHCSDLSVSCNNNPLFYSCPQFRTGERNAR